MPYVSQSNRSDLDIELFALLDALRKKYTNGNLNYCISTLLDAARTHDGVDGDWNYEKLSDAMRALECAKTEFYRRVGAPLEDDAISRNGDIITYLPVMQNNENRQLFWL